MLPDNDHEGEEQWAWPQVPYQAQRSAEGAESSARGVTADTQSSSSFWSLGTKIAMGCACFLLVLLAVLCCVARMRRRPRKAAVLAVAAHKVPLDEQLGASGRTTKHMHPRFTPAACQHVRPACPSHPSCL